MKRFVSVLTVAAIMAAMLAASAIPALTKSPLVELLEGTPASFSTCIYGHGSITIVDVELACMLAAR